MVNILTQNITYLDPASLTAAGVSGAGRSSACFDECISSSWSSPLEGVELLFSVLGQFPVLDLRKTRIVSPEKLETVMIFEIHPYLAKFGPKISLPKNWRATDFARQQSCSEKG